MTATEYRQLIEFLEHRFGEVDRRFTEMDRRFTEMDGRFTGLDGRLTGPDGGLIELRHDMLACFEETSRRLDRLEQGALTVRQIVWRIEAGLAQRTLDG